MRRRGDALRVVGGQDFARVRSLLGPVRAPVALVLDFLDWPPRGDVVPVPLIRRAGDHDIGRSRAPLIPQRTYGRVGATPGNDVSYPPPSCGRLGSGEWVDAVGEGDPV